MRFRALAAAVGVTLLALSLPVWVQASPREARKATCGWTGAVRPLITAADRKVTKLDFGKQVADAFGKGATVSRITRLELDLSAPVVGSVKPTDAAGLTSNAVVYRLTVTVPGAEDEIAGVALHYTGLCFQRSEFFPRSWVGTIGFEEPAIDADKALRLAQAFRRAHSDAFPLDNPLSGMQLMRATTRPPDFGKQRWFVDYEVAPGVVQVLAVYMNGKVKVAVR